MVLTTVSLTITMNLQEETGSSPKWVTRFQLPEFLLNRRDFNGTCTELTRWIVQFTLLAIIHILIDFIAKYFIIHNLHLNIDICQFMK